MKKLYLSTLMLFLITIIAFFSFLFLMSQNNQNQPANISKNPSNNKNINANINTEKKIDNGLPLKIYHVNGKIIKITKDAIFVEAIILEGKKLEFNKERKTEIIEIEIKPNTKINKLTFIPKSDGKSYSSIIQKIQFSDLKINDRIEATAGSDIKGAKKFIANSIKVMPRSIQ
ncbi:MAG: hypothetical protein U9O55_00490 [Patescibacteria group bacterium]|nr:hypothetical protein [Patescibacteria group bacterium]